MVLDVSPSGALLLFGSDAPDALTIHTSLPCSAHEFLTQAQVLANLEAKQQGNETCGSGAVSSPAGPANYRRDGSATRGPSGARFLIGGMMDTYARNLKGEKASDVESTVDTLRGSEKSLTAYVPSFGFRQ